MAKGIYIGDKKNIAQNVSAAYPSHKGIAIKAIAAFVGDENNKAVLHWGEAPSAIAFMIDGKQYYAKSGSTWAEWLNSTTNSFDKVEYNSNPCISKDGGKSFVADESGEFIKTTDTITDKGNYASYVPLTVDGTAIKVLAGTTWRAWATSDNVLYGIYNSYISKDSGTTVICDQNGDPVSADSIISSGTYTSINFTISFVVGSLTYSVPAGTTWRTWLGENPVLGYSISTIYIATSDSNTFLCNSDGERVKHADVITSGTYSSMYCGYWYNVVLMRNGYELAILGLGGMTSGTGKVICDVETKTIKLVCNGEEDVYYLSQLKDDNVVGLYIYPREGDINDRATEWTVNANVENTFNVHWDINNNICTHPAESIVIEQHDGATHLCRCTENYCGYEWLETHSFDSNGKCTVCGYVKPSTLCSICGNPLSECPSCGEVGWCADCVKCESCGYELTTKTFTVNGITYQFDTGMTWAQWVASAYNTKPYYVTNGHISVSSSQTAGVPMTIVAAASPSDLIVAGANYAHTTTTYKPSGGTTTTQVNFTIDGTSYSVNVGSTWNDFYKNHISMFLVDDEGYLTDIDGWKHLVTLEHSTKCHNTDIITSVAYIFKEM